MIIPQQLGKESVDRCKKIIDEINTNDMSAIVLGFLEDPKAMKSLLQSLLAFAMYLDLAERDKESKAIIDAATVLSIEQTLFNQFLNELKPLPPNN